MLIFDEFELCIWSFSFVPCEMSKFFFCSTEDDITQKIWDLAFLSDILEGQMTAKEKHNESKLQFAWDNLQHAITQLYAGNVTGLMPHMQQVRLWKTSRISFA